MPLDQNEAKRQLDAENGKVAYAAPTTPIMGNLCSTVGTASTPGTELVNSGGSSYARQNTSTAMPAATVNANGASATNTSGLTWSNLPASTVRSTETFDSAATPRRQRFGALAAEKTVALLDSISMPAGQYVHTQS